jgi:hypothetical protein
MVKDLKGRAVTICKYERIKGEKAHTYKTEKVIIGGGTFLEFGVSHEEFDTGAGNYSTALVLMKDGTVLNIEVELIKFNRISEVRG